MEDIHNPIAHGQSTCAYAENTHNTMLMKLQLYLQKDPTTHLPTKIKCMTQMIVNYHIRSTWNKWHSNIRVQSSDTDGKANHTALTMDLLRSSRTALKSAGTESTYKANSTALWMHCSTSQGEPDRSIQGVQQKNRWMGKDIYCHTWNLPWPRRHPSSDSNRYVERQRISSIVSHKWKLKLNKDTV